MTSHGAHPKFAVTQIVEAQNSAQAEPQNLEVIVEEPIAIVFNGSSVAVMMATPSDLRDMAFGFALTEGYINAFSDVEAFEIIRHDEGIEARFWVVAERADAIAARRRAMAGPVGCGLCGIESLEQVRKPARQQAGTLSLKPLQITDAMAEIYAWQSLKQRTRSTHAAAFFVPGRGIIAAREDVGRHNALDKLIGCLFAQDIDPASGAFVMTSRLSLELVQKCAIAGSSILIAASGPTSLAIKTAQENGISLIGFCRGDSYETFC